MSNPATPSYLADLANSEVLTDSGLVKIRQGYGMQRVYRLHGLVQREGGPCKVRIDINRNAYDNQSHYRAELWTGTGWAYLTHINPESMNDQPPGNLYQAEGVGVTWMPSYVHDSHDPDWHPLLLTAVETVVLRLLTDARAILS